MHNILATYSKLLKEHLTNVFPGFADLDPEEFSRENFKVRAIFIVSIIYLQHQPGNDYSLGKVKKWIENTFGLDNFFLLAIKSCDSSLQKLIKAHFSEGDFSGDVHIATLYENLLSVESGSGIDQIEISSNKNYRNKLGSYYTPLSFARFSTHQTVDLYFEQKFGIKDSSTFDSLKWNEEVLEKIGKITFADFSCGAGNFINELISYFEAIFLKWKLSPTVSRNLLTQITMNICAIDVDIIALEVCRANLLLKVGMPELYSKTARNFVHGNFLLHSTNISPAKERIDIFSRGFIYHDGLSIDRSSLRKIDICLGNPPWEKIRFEEKKFFALHLNRIASIHVKKWRQREVMKLESGDSKLAAYSKVFRSKLEQAKNIIKNDEFYFYSSHGELNTYSLFTEAAARLSGKDAAIGLVLKSAVVTSQVNKGLFKFLIDSNRVSAVYDFINRRKIFNIDSRERFCFLLLGHSKSKRFHLAMNVTEIEEIPEASVHMDYETLKQINPLTGMVPNVSLKEELGLLIRISKEFPIFNKIYPNVRFGRIVHLTQHSNFISKQAGNGKLAIYEGKFFHQYDSKYSGFNGVSSDDRYKSKSSSVLLRPEDKSKVDYYPEARFYISKDKWKELSKNHNQSFMLAWRSLTSATNARTSIATILPFLPAIQSVQFLTTNAHDTIYLCGVFNSVIYDFLLKMKLSGIDLTKTVVNQIPIPVPESEVRIVTIDSEDRSIRNHIEYLVYLLFHDDLRLERLFAEFKVTDKSHLKRSKRELIRMIDLLFFQLYSLSSKDLDVVLRSFKDYGSEDLDWFKNKLTGLTLNESIGFG